MADAIVLREHGAPEVLRLESVEVGAPGLGQIRLRQTAIGVNFHDCYVRTGLYRTLELPGILGLEAAGTIDAVGPDVVTLRPGDRVAYFTPSYGAYASERLIPADAVVPLPDAIDDRTAAAVMLKGLTAHMLLHGVHRVGPNDTILVQAAAGGVGSLLCQWASHLGAKVIGTVGSVEKAELARRHGCHHVILYREEDFVARVREITDGRGVDVAYNSVGRDTFFGSLESLAVLGHLVNFGQSSGPVEPLLVSRLSARSNSVTRPMLFHYTAQTATRDKMASDLFKALADGTLVAGAPTVFSLADAAGAHRALEARETSGSVVLVPS